MLKRKQEKSARKLHKHKRYPSSPVSPVSPFDSDASSSVASPFESSLASPVIDKTIKKKLFPSSPYPTPQEDLLYREKVRTESLGKMFEMAICKAIDTPFCGNYKYHSPPQKLVSKLKELTSTLRPGLRHTAAGGARYDFSADDEKVHISAKTSKQAMGKVAPQVIGQPSVEKFREMMGIPEASDLRQEIYYRIVDMLPVIASYTFDSRIVYYNQKRGEILRIQLTSPIDFSELSFSWTRTPEQWTNSNTLKADGVSLLEIQIHSKSRSNLTLRWNLENVIKLFSEHFDVKRVLVSP